MHGSSRRAGGRYSKLERTRPRDRHPHAWLRAIGGILATLNLCLASNQSSADEPGIYVMRADGSATRKVVAVDGFLHHESPRWSHDGKRVAFNAFDGATRTKKIFVVNVDGSELVELGDSAMPDWSPDDKQLTFYRDVGDQPGIWVMNADGKSAAYVCDGAWPRWSPDGATIAFTVGTTIETLDLVTDDVRAIVDHGFAQRPGAFDWSRDGKRLAFFTRSVDGGPRELYIIDVEHPQRDLKPRYSRPGMVGGHVSWSPDDKRLAFTIDSYIHVMDVEGESAPKRLSGQSQRSRDPAWSPDGNWIAFARRN